MLPNTLIYEIGLAHAVGKPLVLIAERGTNIPFDLAHHGVVFYGEPLTAAEDELNRAIASALSGSLSRASQLFEEGMYPGAIAAAAVVLEQRLAYLLHVQPVRAVVDSASIDRMVKALHERQLISDQHASGLLRVANLKDCSVRSRDRGQPSEGDAAFVLEKVRHFLETTQDSPC